MKNFLSVVVLAFLLTGCINYEQRVLIYPDGSGNMEIHYWMHIPDSTATKSVSNLGIFIPDSIRNEFSSPFVKILDITSYTDSTDSTIHSVIKIEFSSIDSLNTIKAFAQSEFSLKDGASNQKIFSQFIPPVSTGFGIDGSKFYVKYVYEIRGDIITHNATVQQKNILTWQYNLSEIGRGKTISVTFKPYKLKETPKWIYYLAGLVLLIVTFYLFRKKKD
ncbi:Hypothetical protein IALB_0588 [Ignavibacterium album JCM 16511]|uniref:Lipoprotein n=1 Tax=Ignavibacterium album (strain DSM 19864 / JCM 16511 / NBRC 101810 / Mat9-16) TaxID=945713 RepID=I0AH43_IGNAJ|nr:hypothetical protein [Ignavibacterium album]AFH48300.1 Hypothetical protein IALB_0588 [Ignavibacterium album JCM 16511]